MSRILRNAFRDDLPARQAAETHLKLLVLAVVLVVAIFSQGVIQAETNAVLRSVSLTNFTAATTLTWDQVQTVLELVKECGMKEPKLIDGRDYAQLPTIAVKSAERVDGRKTTYDQVHVFYKKWGGFESDDAKRLGDFWVNWPQPRTHEFISYEKNRKPARVEVEGDVTAANVATIINGFAQKEFHSVVETSPGHFYSAMFPPIEVIKPQTATPQLITHQPNHDEYRIYFPDGSGSDFINFKLKDGEISVQSTGSNRY